jgi:hypothetical protein
MIDEMFTIRPEPLLQCRLRGEEGSREVDGEHRSPVVVGHLRHRAVDRDAGVVDEDVEAAVLLDHFGDGAPAIVRVPHVARVRAGRHAELGQLGQERLGLLVVVVVAGGDRGARGREVAGDGRADAARTPGDQGHLPVQRAGRERSAGLQFNDGHA